MSYHVQIFRRETQAAYEAADDPAFFEQAEAFTPFTKDDLELLVERLELNGFTPGKPRGKDRTFTCAEWKADALLTDVGLYLSGSGEDSIFEILMMTSELASEDLAKFDPQAGGWE